MNEGHASLVPVTLLAARAASGRPVPERVGEVLATVGDEDVAAIRRQCVFTTHTPVPAGHDRFATDVAEAVLGRPLVTALGRLGCLEEDGTLNMTVLGMRLSGFVNGVSQRHQRVTQQMFPTAAVDGITNGVHAASWAAPAMAELFDRRLAGWRRDGTRLRAAAAVDAEEITAAHASAKADLCREVAHRTGISLDAGALTIGLARRFATYKRNALVFSDPDRLRAIAEKSGPIQVVCAGKAHPHDRGAQQLLRRVVEVAERPPDGVTVAFLADYGMSLARLLCAGSDVWLNTPRPPEEASGTSGMKAALNGVPSVSTLDGWWVEGHVEGVTGWAIGHEGDDPATHAELLYRCLEEAVAPCFYDEPERFARLRRSAIALNGSYFSAERMVGEYVRRAYTPLA